MSAEARAGWSGPLVILVATLVLAIVTFVLNKIPQPPDWPEYPTWIVGWLTVPVRLPGLSDVRYVTLAAGTALLLLIVAAGGKRSGAALRDEVKSSERDGVSASAVVGAMSVVVLGFAVISSIAAGSWEVSRGWTFQFAAASAWMLLLARLLSPGQARRLLVGAGGCAWVGCGLAILHRVCWGERFMELPIGPVTLTAALSAATAAGGVAALTAWAERGERGVRPSGRGLAALLCYAAVTLGTCLLARRRGVLLAMSAALGLTLALFLWGRLRSNRQRWAIVALVTTVLGGGAGFLVRRAAAIRKESTLESAGFRLTYWSHILELMPGHFLTGHGPDMMVFRMTDKMARERAAKPRYFVGNVDYDAHNEWLQAAFDLGLIGGLMYAAIPAFALWTMIRAYRRSTERTARAALLACIAALTCILINESASVNLRHPILSAWYFTIMGVGLALARGDGRARASSGELLPPAVSRMLALALSVTIVTIVVSEVRRAIAHADGLAMTEKDPRAAVEAFGRADGRLRVNQWLSATFERALAELKVVRAMHKASPDGRLALKNPDGSPSEYAIWSRRAVESWRRVTSFTQAYSGAGFALAEALTLADQKEEACRQLHWMIEHVNPFDRRVNALMGAVCVLTTSEKIECVCRALRETGWDDVMQERMGRAFEDAEALSAWRGRVAEAEASIRGSASGAWRDPLAPERVRLEAGRLVATGSIPEAARLQRVAYEGYEKLREERSVFRRPAMVEADAAYRAAQYLFYSDPLRYEEACRLMSEAELRGIDGLLREPAPQANPSSEYVGGQVVPVERPGWFRNIARFSAMMRMAKMGDPDAIMMRIEWSLAGQTIDERSMNAVLGKLARELTDIYSRYPAPQRPRSYQRLAELAARHGPASGVVTDPPQDLSRPR